MGARNALNLHTTSLEYFFFKASFKMSMGEEEEVIFTLLHIKYGESSPKRRSKLN